MSHRVLLTGGAGYIGSHVAVALVQAGHQVSILDNLSRGRIEAVERARRLANAPLPLHVVDLCDGGGVDSVLRQEQPTAVVHVAAYKSVSESVAHPERYERNNVLATQTLAQAMVRNDLTHIVYASTGSVYGDRACPAYLESDPTDPINPYASTKLGGERVLADHPSLSAAFMRFFNVVGAHPSGELGEYGDNSTNLLPILLDQLTGQRDHLTVFGTDWPTRDGTCIRDYVHVCDIASALVAALDHLDNWPGSRIFNVGTGTGTSVREMVDAVQTVSGHPLRVVDGARRAGDPGVSVAGVARIQEELGWRAKHSLQSMVQTAVDWKKRSSQLAV